MIKLLKASALLKPHPAAPISTSRGVFVKVFAMHSSFGEIWSEGRR